VLHITVNATMAAQPLVRRSALSRALRDGSPNVYEHPLVITN